ncbi:hypothetical protein SAMN05444164_6903 [Bradyrhizobium erythrophlei]|uniref:Uncharacterized protein n=1 Tax=Bradyrhizobium erythrophlei TaxID=1437360 RepID=A0A1H5G2X6_9BRAD|nr:hypothetical protein SAMN05444164_6903 [Bradyrhizobium erythrophlei]
MQDERQDRYRHEQDAEPDIAEMFGLLRSDRG